MRPVQPMLATAGTLPTGRDWAYEFKWDGVRTLVDSSTSGLTLTSRLGNDVTVAYPELAGLAEIADDVLLDGEIVSLVDGRPSFSALQSRMHVRKAVEARRLAARAPVTYLAFDVLRLYGVDLTGRTFADRRATLERLEVAGPHWTVSPLFDDGPATKQAATDNGLEGVRGQAAVLGLPARAAHQRLDQGQALAPAGVRRRRLGARRGRPVRRDRLAAARRVRGHADLIYTGQVGTGFSAAALRSMEKRLQPYVVDSSPFVAMPPDVRGRPITWVRPEVVVEVEFAEWTVDGRLRFASFQGVRTDKRPEEVVRER